MPEGSDNKQTADSAAIASGAAQGGFDTAQAFISYASADSAIANAVCNALEREGVRCWIAPRDVTPGELYAANIVHALDTTRVVILVLSEHAAASAHVLREVERAISKRHAVLTFRIDLAPLPEELEYFLNTSQWLDASAMGVDRTLPRLVDVVKSVLAKSTVAAVANQTPFVAAKASTRPNRTLLALAILIAAALAYVGIDRLWLSKRDGAQRSLVEATPASPSESLPAMSPVSAQAIAVLPFVNMSSDKEQEYFSDGLSEELLNLLAKIPELRVAARTSSFYYKGKDVKLSDVARELQVAHLLEGSVRKSGNRVRITAQLIRASDGYHQWSETYDRTLEDVFAVQEEIAAAVVSELKIRLLSAAPKARETNPEAYALYLQAQQLDRQGTGRFDESIALYQQVLAIDPNYAPAWLELGKNYVLEVNLGVRPVADLEKSREMANKALAIDPEYGLAHAALGWLALNYDLNLVAAAKHFERALALDPTDPRVLAIAHDLSWALGRRDSLRALVEYMLSRDPMAPGSYAALGTVYFIEGRPEDAIANYRTALKLSPEMIGMHEAIGDALLFKGDYEAALTEYRKEQIEPFRLAGLAQAHHKLGQASESDAALAGLIEKHSSDWAFYIAVVYTYRGQNDRAFVWLEKAAANRDYSLNTLQLNPWLKELHDDPRWLPFLRKLGRAPEQLAAIKFELKVPTH